MEAEKQPMQTAALFDFDGTLAKSDSALPFILHLARHYPRSALGLFQLGIRLPAYSLGLIPKERMKKFVLQMFSCVPDSERKPFLKDFHDRILRPRYFEAGLRRLQWHKQQKHLLLLVSASMDTYLTQVAAFLEFDILVCTQTEMQPLPRVVGQNCYEREKVERLRQLKEYSRIDWKSSWAYSDHISDLPMLELCGHPVATTPHPPLKRHALQKGWEIVQWG